jgi:hypothetical protein
MSTASVTSSGPPRIGIVQYAAPNLWQFGGVDVSGLMAVPFGSLSGDCGPAAPVSCHGIFAAPGGGRTSFALGQPFVLDVTSILRGLGSFGEGAGPFGGGTTLGFRLFESDGITPVGIQVVPEPAACMTGALGLHCSGSAG